MLRLIIFLSVFVAAAPACAQTEQQVRAMTTLFDQEKQMQHYFYNESTQTEDISSFRSWGALNCPTHQTPLELMKKRTKMFARDVFPSVADRVVEAGNRKISRRDWPIFCLSYAAVNYEKDSILLYARAVLATDNPIMMRRARGMAASLLVIGSEQFRDVDLAKALLEEAIADPGTDAISREGYAIALATLK
jgi:hypothetical protein